MNLNRFTHYPNVYLPVDGAADYLHPAFMMRIDPRAVNTIVQVGCFDATDTLLLQRKFSADVHAFECNPEILPQTRKTDCFGLLPASDLSESRTDRRGRW
jgi:hypothetical protein